MQTSYVFPQENGARADVRWLALLPPTALAGPCLSFVCAGAGAPPFSAAAAARLGADPDGDGGLSGAPHALACASVSRHSALELHTARRQHELPAYGVSAAAAAAAAAATGTTAAAPEASSAPRPLHVHLDAAHMGVGGDDSWSPAVHEGYLLPPGRYRFGVAVVASGGGAREQAAGAGEEAGASASAAALAAEQHRRRLTGLHHALARRWMAGHQAAA